MKKYLSLTVICSVILTLIIILTSCGPSSPTTAGGGGGKGKPEGDLAIAISSIGEEGFLPVRGEGGDQTFAWENVYDVPIYVKEKTFEAYPGIAESWQMSADAKTLTFKLRKGVKFHGTPAGDWGELTAEDMKYSYQRYAEPGSQSNRASVAREMESFEIPDPYTLIIHLKTGNPVFWRQLDMDMGNALPILCKKYVTTVGDDAAFKTPVGTGPYNLVDHAKGNYMKFEALDSHWRVVPEFKTLTMRIVPEESTRIAMLKTGEVDGTAVAGAKIPEIKAAGLEAGTAGYGGSIVSYIFGGMIVKEDTRYKDGVSMADPWADKRVREAMNIAIDREAMLKALFKGTAVPVAYPFYAPGAADVKPYPYDVNRAKQLMAEAGFANGFNLDLYTWARPGTPEIPKMGEVMAQNWKDIGINAKIIPSELPAYRPNVYAAATKGQIYPWRISIQTDPSGEPYAYFLPNSQGPLATDDGMTPIIKDLLPTIDEAQRNAKFAKLLKYLSENYLTIPLANIQNAYAWNQKKIADWPHGNAPQPGYWAYIKHATPRNTFRLFTP